MSMKLSFKMFVLLFSSLLWNCKNHNSVRIEGKLKTPVDARIWLGNMHVKNIVAKDSTIVDESGRFSLDFEANEPSLYLLKAGPQSIYLVLKPKDMVNIEIDNTLDETAYYVQGSTDSRLVQELITKQKRVLDEITEISLEYENSKNKPSTFLANKEKLDKRYSELLRKHKSYTENFIAENPGSLACIFALYQNFGRTNQPLFDKIEDFKTFNFVDSCLTANYPTTPAVKALNIDLITIKDQIKYKNYSEKLIEPGKKAPELEVTSINGSALKLSDFDSNPVVYFFFALWNKESVNELIAINDIYKKNRYKGLKVIGISFDKSEERLRSFIEENEILFPIACDFKYWDSEYVTQFGVRKIPDIILLNQDHIIDQKNINPQELNNTLKEWRKNNVF